MIAAFHNRSPLGLIQTREDWAEEKGDEEAGKEEGGGEPENGFAKARSDFAGFGVLRVASPRAQARAHVVAVDKTRGDHDAGDGEGPRFVARESNEPGQSRKRGCNGGAQPREDKQGRERAAKQRPHRSEERKITQKRGLARVALHLLLSLGRRIFRGQAAIAD